MSSFAEGLPVVLMEAMAAGVSVVATRIAGIPELVTNEHSGLIVTPGDANAITRAICRLLGDPELRNRLARAGREKVEREFNINVEIPVASQDFELFAGRCRCGDRVTSS